MFASADVLATLHLILQTGFLVVTFLLLLVTVVNRMRVRRVLLTWRQGLLSGIPMWPSIFLVAVVLFFGGAYATGQELPFYMFVGYFAGGLFWLSAGLLSASVLVTEFGLVQNVNRTDRAVAWGQVVDYFKREKGRQKRYVFFYLDHTDTRRRLEITVPTSQHAFFCEVIGEKIDTRFDLSAQKVYGKKELEG